MADYSKRDARKAWVADMAAHAGEMEEERALPRCYCGEPAVVGFYPVNGANRFFCEAHKAQADALATRSATRRS